MHEFLSVSEEIDHMMLLSTQVASQAVNNYYRDIDASLARRVNGDP